MLPTSAGCGVQAAALRCCVAGVVVKGGLRTRPVQLDAGRNLAGGLPTLLSPEQALPVPFPNSLSSSLHELSASSNSCSSSSPIKTVSRRRSVVLGNRRTIRWDLQGGRALSRWVRAERDGAHSSQESTRPDYQQICLKQSGKENSVDPWREWILDVLFRRDEAA